MFETLSSFLCLGACSQHGRRSHLDERGVSTFSLLPPWTWTGKGWPLLIVYL